MWYEDIQCVINTTNGNTEWREICITVRVSDVLCDKNSVEYLLLVVCIVLFLICHLLYTLFFVPDFYEISK